MAQLWIFTSSGRRRQNPTSRLCSRLSEINTACHTPSMTLTTIKVDTAIRDRLKAQAESHGRTLGEHLRVLAERESREQRFAGLRADIHATDPALLVEVEREVAHWDSTAADGLPRDDSIA